MKDLCLSADPHGFGLIQRALHGDEEAFGELFARYRGHIHTELRWLLRDSEGIDDLTQEAFARAHESLRRFDVARPATPLTWLSRIARNLAVDELRRREWAVAWDPEDITARRDEFACARDAYAELEGRRSVGEMAPRMRLLPANQREALILVHVHGYSYDEAAEKMGTTPGNVRQLKSRALRKIDRRAETRHGGVGQRRSKPMSARLRPLPVLAARRGALWSTDARSAFGRPH